MTGRTANTLSDMNLSIGDRVAVQIEKSPEALAIYAACVQSGLVYLPLNVAYTPSEVSYFIEDSGAKVLICQDSPEVHTINSKIKSVLSIETLNSDGTGSFTELMRDRGDFFYTVNRDYEDIVALLYTSGTTGVSKGAMLSQKNLLSNAKTLADIWQFTKDDVLLHALPIFHTHGLFVATNVTLIAGGSMLFFKKFDIDSIIENFQNATTMMGVPTFYTRLLNDYRFDKNLTRHIRLFISGSAPLLSETHFQFESRTGHRILERYGMTETNMNTSNPYYGERRAGTVGLPLPGVEIRITNSKNREVLPDGEIGEIEVRGPNVFQGYWEMPEKTSEELQKDGFFITGDIGFFDQDGYLSISGRNKDLIISGGYNIYPKEIELLIDDQPGIMESAVIGVAHNDFGEVAIGILVADEDITIDLEELLKTIKGSLANFKQPKKLFLIPELPRNTMGKVQKNILREEYKDLFTKKVPSKS